MTIVPGQPSVAAPHRESDREVVPAWQALLQRALTGEGVSSHFQPIVDLFSGSIVGYEALARFDGYPVSDPITWFEAAHRHGLGAELESLTLRTALAARDDLPLNTFLAVNVRPDVLLRQEVREVWQEHDSLDGIVVELTEHARVDSPALLEPVLAELRAAGALIALDDTGAGYAGLQTILGIRPQVIKLDRQLVTGIDRDETKQALVEMIGAFAARIDAEVIAEGIERPSELETLLTLGVPLAQGFLLARPAPPWAGVDGAASVRLREGRPLRRSALTLSRLVETAPVVTDRASALRALSGQDEVVVLVDGDGRPVATLADGGVHSATEPSMQMRVDTPITAAAQRAVARLPRQRFAPMLATDEDGRLVGIVRMERIIGHLADQPGLAPPPTVVPRPEGPVGPVA